MKKRILLLKAEKQKGVANKDLLANPYQHLLEECLTAGAADMNNYCPVNSSHAQVAGQFLCQAYLFVYTICNAWGRLASLWRPSIQVIGHQDTKQMFIGQQILLVTPLFLFSRRILLSVSRPLSIMQIRSILY